MKYFSSWWLKHGETQSNWWKLNTKTNIQKQKYKNTKIQKYKNIKIQKYKIQKYKNTKIQKYIHEV